MPAARMHTPLTRAHAHSLPHPRPIVSRLRSLLHTRGLRQPCFRDGLVAWQKPTIQRLSDRSVHTPNSIEPRAKERQSVLSARVFISKRVLKVDSHEHWAYPVRESVLQKAL